MSYLEFFFGKYYFGHTTFLYLHRCTSWHLQSFFLISGFLVESLNTGKNLSDFKNFPADMVLLGARANICTTPFLEAQELHFWSTLKANVCIFLHISVRNFFFQRYSNILSDGGGLGEGWVISWRWLAVWVS